MMQNGQFFTAGDDGQIRPVSEVLKISADVILRRLLDGIRLSYVSVRLCG